jgi:YfiH family protein
MIRIEFLEKRGLTLAAMSGIAEGDCSGQAPSMDARRRFLEQCHAPFERLTCPRQVHGVNVVAVEDTCPQRPEADALITDTPGLPLGITVADCVPLFLFDPRRKALGLTHAGREGTRGDIAGKTVAALEEHYTVRPEDLLAMIGPSAGPDRYEVSPEMAEDWIEADLPARGRDLDLWEANRRQLLQAGLIWENIKITGYCTISGNLFHSYRATGTSARNLCLAML